MTCDEAVAELWRHLEGDTASELALDDHLTRCRRCCGEAEFAEMLRDLWARTSGDVLPDAVRLRLEGTLATLGEPA